MPPFPLLAVDPSSTMIGWALFNPGPTCLLSDSTIVPNAQPDHRVLLVGDKINEIVHQRCGLYRPAAALIEIPDFIADFARPHIVRFFRAVGVAERSLHLCGLPVYHVPASKDKTQNRKQHGRDRFMRIVTRPPQTDDESDAFCMGWDFITQYHLQAPPAPAPPPQIDEDAQQWDGTVVDEDEGY